MKEKPSKGGNPAHAEEGIDRALWKQQEAHEAQEKTSVDLLLRSCAIIQSLGGDAP
jgi:hypothetical protein